MASTEKLPSGKYRPIARDPEGKKIPGLGTFEKQRDAQHEAEEAESRARRQAKVAKGSISAKIKWGEWWEMLAPTRVFESDRHLTERSMVASQVMPRWGETPLNEIETDDVQEWINDLAKHYSPAYVDSIYCVFRVSINSAINHKPPILFISPLKQIKLPKVPKKAMPFVMQDESHQLAEQLRAGLPSKRPGEDLRRAPQDAYARAIEFAFETGLRPNELIGMHNDQIDRTGWVTVRTVFVQRSGKMRDRPKNGNVRTVPLSTRALEIYNECVAGRNLRKPCRVEHYGKRPCRHALVFVTSDGEALSTVEFRRLMVEAAEATGLPERSPYALRRGFGTHLGRAGIDVFELAELMGHADISQTRDYVQQSPQVRNRVLAALGDPEATRLRLVGPEDQRGTKRGTEPDSQGLADANEDDHRKTS